TQLLDLKTSHYTLIEKSNKQEQELKFALEREAQIKDDLVKANVTIAKSKKAKDVFKLEQELEISRLKLNVQEEEFRLQQSTLLTEINKVFNQNQLLKSENEKLKNQQCARFQNEEIPLDEAQIASLQSKMRNYEALIEEYKSKPVGRTENSQDLISLPSENAEFHSVVTSLRNELVDLKAINEKQRQQNEEISTKCAYFQQQVTELNDKLRRKQESYQILNSDKERQYGEYKKSLDSIVAKKDNDIDEMAKEMILLRKSLAQAKEIELLETSTLNSVQTELDRIRSSFEEISSQNELLQVQLQESLGANDCLSNQLQEARMDVSKMQAQADDAIQTSDRRKTLIDEINKHLEHSKDEFKREKDALIVEYESTLKAKNDEIFVLNVRKNIMLKLIYTRFVIKDRLNALENVSIKLSTIENASEAKNNEIRRLCQEVNEYKLKFELCQVQNEELLEKQKMDFDNEMKSSIEHYENLLKQNTHDINVSKEEIDKFKETIENCKQDSKDKMDQLIMLDRKHGHIVKDLKRQIQSEKKRADRLQERIQEILSELSRNRSPGLEDIKFYQENVKETRTNGDTGSVCSWTVVGGNHSKEHDRHSNVGDNDSESSVTIVESDDNDLIGRIAQLQRQNFELSEKVHILEESSSAMADDLVRKAAVIEQLLKEKPIINMSASTSSTPTNLTMTTATGATNSPEHRLPQSLKKMFDLVKIDQSAGDIRDMNKRLQLLLEETLTKNMHLQRDLELVSKEVVRLKALDYAK
uniref:GRIP1-associated protein 1 n=1 Tax=Romanomermis culicivorax TaxID=13658 RepID=A0A915L8G3_ROMCU